MFVDNLIVHTHNEINHFGTANTMAALRGGNRDCVRIINECNVCKAYRVRPYGTTATAELPKFRIKSGRPFEITGVDYAGPLMYKHAKKLEGKLIFTCATSAVHFELTKSHG